jgi:DNA-binding transcriptional LysR family regulator
MTAENATAIPGEVVPYSDQLRFRHLRALRAVAETGAVSRAAVQLGVAQASITRILAELDVILDAPALRRHGRSVELTDLGMKVLGTARRIDATLEALGEEITLRKSGAMGVARVGVVPGWPSALLAEASFAFKRRWPDTTLSLVAGGWPHMVRALRDGQLDLLLARLPDDMGQDFDGLPLTSVPTCIFTSPAHPVLQNPEPGWRDLMDSPWILAIPGVPSRYYFEQHLQRLGLKPPRHIVEVDTHLLLRAFLPRMRACAAIMQDTGAAMVRAGQAAPLNLILPSRVMDKGIFWRKGAPIDPTARLFRQMLLHCHEAGNAALPPGWPLEMARIRAEDREALAR